MSTITPTPDSAPTETAYETPTDARVDLTTAFVEPGAHETNEQKDAINNASSEVGKALLVTSNSARTATANNVSKMQTATSGLAGSTPADTAPGADQTSTSTTGETAGSTAGAAGSTTDAATTKTTKVDANQEAVKGIKDPAVATQYKSALDSLDKQAASATSIVNAAAATLKNDPAAAAAIQQIKDKFAVQIQQMQDKNKLIIGRTNTSIGAFGGLGPMSQNFLSDQQDRATMRISDLVAQEQDLILKANIAYKEQDTKALNDAMNAYDKVNSDKLKAINDLLTETHKQVSEQQAQARLDQATSKAQLATDVSTSTNVASSILQKLNDAGITDQDQIDEYLNSVAEEYGIENPDILRSAVIKARTTKTKDDLLIAKRSSSGNGSKKTTTDGSFSYTKDDIDSYTTFLQKGGTGPDGQAYNGRGKNDQYVDPGAYVAALQDWTDNGGTPQGFVKKFPVSNINPSSYSKLPAAVRPKTSKTTKTPA